MKPLEALAKKRGLRIEERGLGHYQIIGGSCLVNYYPQSKRRSAYIAGSRAGETRHFISPEKAIEMAFEPAPEGWRPKQSGIGEPSKRTPEQWAALLPNTQFAWKKENDNA